MDNFNQIQRQHSRVIVHSSVRVPAQQLEPVADTVFPSVLGSSNTNFPCNQRISNNQIQLFYRLEQQLRLFWSNEIQMIARTIYFKNHSLPLSHTRRIMKYDPEVKMISAESPIIFAKACEMFIFELTLRSWVYAELQGRRILQKSDIAKAILRIELFDFLEYIISEDEDNFPLNDEPNTNVAAVTPNYYTSHQSNVGAVGTTIGPAGEEAIAMYAGQQQVPLQFWAPWP